MTVEAVVSIVWMIPILLAFLARIVWWIFYSQLDDKFLSNENEGYFLCITVWPLATVVFLISTPVYVSILLLEWISNKIENYRKLRCSQKNSPPVTK